MATRWRLLTYGANSTRSPLGRISRPQVFQPPEAWVDDLLREAKFACACKRRGRQLGRAASENVDREGGERDGGQNGECDAADEYPVWAGIATVHDEPSKRERDARRVMSNRAGYLPFH